MEKSKKATNYIIHYICPIQAGVKWSQLIGTTERPHMGEGQLETGLKFITPAQIYLKFSRGLLLQYYIYDFHNFVFFQIEFNSANYFSI